MVFVDVRLERKEGILCGEAGVYCLPSGSNWDEVYIGVYGVSWCILANR